jgi:hypothetical protein
MINLEIPDPFMDFVTNKYKNYTGTVYDFFAREWHFTCRTCKEKMYAPTKKTITKTRLYHTRNICLGGY